MTTAAAELEDANGTAGELTATEGATEDTGIICDCAEETPALEDTLDTGRPDTILAAESPIASPPMTSLDFK